MKINLEKILDQIKYYVFFRGNKIKYLRSKGVKIGVNCQIKPSL